MSGLRHELVMPDLGLGEARVTASAWHVPVGRSVVEGERLLEVLAGEVTVDLPAPVSGRLEKRLVAEDDVLESGQALALIVAKD